MGILDNFLRTESEGDLTSGLFAKKEANITDSSRFTDSRDFSSSDSRQFTTTSTFSPVFNINSEGASGSQIETGVDARATTKKEATTDASGSQKASLEKTSSLLGGSSTMILVVAGVGAYLYITEVL